MRSFFEGFSQLSYILTMMSAVENRYQHMCHHLYTFYNITSSNYIFCK